VSASIRFQFLTACLLCGACLGRVGAEDAVVVVEDEAPAVHVEDGQEHPTVREARDLAAAGERSVAIEQLELYSELYPEDESARNLLMKLRIEERKAEMRAILSQAASEKEFVLGDPGYEEAKARSPLHIARQLDMVEYLIQEQRFSDAVEQCHRILDYHGDDEAVLTLLDRLMTHLVRLEKRRLERDRALRRGEVVNEIIEGGTMPREQRPIPRTVLIFDEDIAELERERLMQQLRLKVAMINYEEQPLGTILKDLFALAGINYIIRDDALGQETLTIALVDETVEHVLEGIQRMVEVQFNYRGGSVYVTSGESPVLVTEIIRLKSGLTDVLRQTQIGGGGGGEGEEGGAGFDPFAPAGGGGDGEGMSDLERFLEAALVEDGLVSWPAGSQYFLDMKSNTLYVRSTPASISELKRLMQALDYNNVQVLIETRFVLVSTSAMDNLGVTWGAVGQDGDWVFGGAQGGAVNPLGADAAALGGALFNGSSGVRIGGLFTDPGELNVSATLNALEQRGQANVFSEPKILTINNALGQITFTNDVVFVEDFQNRSVGTNDVDTSDDTVVTQQQNVLVPEFGEETEEITLSFRPSIARNSDIVTLFIHPVVRQLVGFETAGEFDSSALNADILGSVPVQRPEFERRELATTLHVQNGQTIVLGGLVQERDEKDRAGIPYLSRIPVFGNLFGNKSKDLERSKLLIFVTAHIIDPSGAKFNEEVRHLRDRARVALPSEARAREAAREALESDLAAERAQEAYEQAAGADDEASGRPSDRLQSGGRRRR